MSEEHWFGQNIKEVIRMVKSIFKKEKNIFDCPFCHNDLKITDTMYKENPHRNSFEWEYSVKCPNCKCLGPKAENYTEALELWNNREE